MLIIDILIWHKKRNKMFKSTKYNLKDGSRLPSIEKDINVIDDYSWTPSQKTYRKNVPYVKLTQYELTGAYLLANMKYWMSQIKNATKNRFAMSSDDPYYGLYPAESTNKTLTLPYYQSYHHIIGNGWSAKAGNPLEDLFKNIIGSDNTWIKLGLKITQQITNTPALGITDTMIWDSASPADYQIKFLLFNTGDDPQTNINKNKKLISFLIFSSLHDKTSTATSVPPALYEVDIPGIRYCPVATMDSVNITNKGHMSTIYMGNGESEIVPDAWEINLNIKELITESRAIYDGALGGKKVKAMMAPPGKSSGGGTSANTNQVNETGHGIPDGKGGFLTAAQIQTPTGNAD